MPVLQKESKLERFYLPSTESLPEEEKAFVDMEIGKLTTEDIVNIDPKAPEMEVGLMMLTARIKGWNFTDEKGEALPVTLETVKMLDIEDFGFLAQKIPQDFKTLDTAEKKT